MNARQYQACGLERTPTSNQLAGLNAAQSTPGGGASPCTSAATARLITLLEHAERLELHDHAGIKPDITLTLRDGARNVAISGGVNIHPIDPAVMLNRANRRLGKTRRLIAVEIITERPRSAIGKRLKRQRGDCWIADWR